MDKLKAIIVDDEEFSRENLKILIEENCPEIIVTGLAATVSEARKLFNSKNPDVVFQDIRMPSGIEGLELIESIKDRQFQVVFVTAFEEFAVRAFNSNAIHYILKPVDIEELIKAASKLQANYQNKNFQKIDLPRYVKTLEELVEKYKGQKTSPKITIKHTKGIKIVDNAEIIRLQADGNCTLIFFNNGNSYLDTRTLKTYESLLSDGGFYRIHKSHLINLNYLKEFLKENGNQAIMKDGTSIPVSRDKLSGFLKVIQGS